MIVYKIIVYFYSFTFRRLHLSIVLPSRGEAITQDASW